VLYSDLTILSRTVQVQVQILIGTRAAVKKHIQMKCLDNVLSVADTVRKLLRAIKGHCNMQLECYFYL
jgi:hypothetical protein